MQNAVGSCCYLFQRAVPILRLRQNLVQTGGRQRQAASKVVAGGFIARCRDQSAETGITSVFGGTIADGDTVRDKLNAGSHGRRGSR